MTPGWRIQAPGPDEAGPSNWIERSAALAVEAQGLGLYHAEDNLMADNFTETSSDLQNISQLISDRFRISPPVYADIFNPLLQEQVHNARAHQHPSDEIYSPTSPLHLVFSSSDSEAHSYNQANTVSRNPQIVLGFQCQSVFFSGKSRRNGALERSRSADSIFLFTGNEEQIRRKKRKKRYEEWDAKGGFTMRRFPLADASYAKALTDVSMARDMDVEVSFPSSSVDRKKRAAMVSPLDPTGDWSLKRSKTSSADLQTEPTVQPMEDDNMAMNFQLTVTGAELEDQRAVVDPPQPPSTQ